MVNLEQENQQLKKEIERLNKQLNLWGKRFVNHSDREIYLEEELKDLQKQNQELKEKIETFRKSFIKTFDRLFNDKIVKKHIRALDMEGDNFIGVQPDSRDAYFEAKLLQRILDFKQIIIKELNSLVEGGK
jgi:chromosome segregation ATPase